MEACRLLGVIYLHNNRDQGSTYCIGPYPTLAETDFFANFSSKKSHKKKKALYTQITRFSKVFSKPFSQNGENLPPKYIY
jgi:hypothetical protein